MTTNTLDSTAKENYFQTRLDSTAPINAETKIISRSSPSNGVVTYTLRIGSVSVPNVSLAEVTDYISAHDLEVFENQTFESDIKEEEIKQQERLAARAQARRHNRVTDSDSASESSSIRARSVSGAPLSGSENVKATAGGRQRPSYTHFYPKQRAPRGSLKPSTSTAESQVNKNHRDSKRRRLREGRDGSMSSAQDAESVYSAASPKLSTQPPSTMEQAAGMVSDGQEESDQMELDNDESHNDIDMPIRQPVGLSNTAEQAIGDKGKGAASAFTFRDHAIAPVSRDVAHNSSQALSAKAKLMASLTGRQAPATPAGETTKASTALSSKPNALRTNDTTDPSANNSVRQVVTDVSDADSDSGSEDSEVYAVEKILAHGLSDPKSHDKSVHGEKSVMLYQVKWEGYDDTTWEPATSFEDTDVLQEYWFRHAQKQKQKQKPST
ncbi:hypothetical protein QM012_006241 [Aureobasidium pullulans]|uniref:Chromo domain-containing protein n=1 Tax=Aureobasidium pullulans TaxID=5580 RepID=A0ABR0TRZ9_AURPU